MPEVITHTHCNANVLSYILSKLRYLTTACDHKIVQVGMFSEHADEIIVTSLNNVSKLFSCCSLVEITGCHKMPCKFQSTLQTSPELNIKYVQLTHLSTGIRFTLFNEESSLII